MKPDGTAYSLADRELSWLSFSHRVLQEAEDPSVPLFERLFFCAIFSSNLDEYFRVRVASLRSLLRLGKKDATKLGFNPHRLLHEIHTTVVRQQEHYGEILGGLMGELAREGIHIVDNRRVDPRHDAFLRDYFDTHIEPHLERTALEGEETTKPFLQNRVVYLVAELWPRDEGEITTWTPKYALLEVPSPPVDRFVTLPSGGDGHEVMYLDDVIRYNLPRFYPRHETGRAYAVKLTRDAELYVDDEFEGDLVEAIRRSLGRRETGLPSRFLYDMKAPYVLVHSLEHGLGLEDEDLVIGGRYHNLSDFMGFPRFEREDLSFPEWPAIPHPTLEDAPSVLDEVRSRDQVVHTPYQSYGHVVRFLHEAAEDPDVEALWLTVYRVARDSEILHALLDAANAGKRVVVFMEVQARFDEESNLEWADRLEAAGVETHYSMPGLKVHAKIALAVRMEAGSPLKYAYVGTGNFNERTAKVYADHGVLTADPRVTDDVQQLFRFLAGEIEEPELHHLLVAPFSLRSGFYDLIEREAEAALRGEPSGMTLKMNALEDPEIIAKLYEASRAGVPIEIIVRGICRLIPGVPGQSETIRVRSILDRYLEHARIYLFHNGGDELMYLASADWMTRNLSRRVEVALPVLDPAVRRQLRQLVDLQLSDNRKARWVDATRTNPYVEANDAPPLRSQEAFRSYVASLVTGG
jgi:polyphosphate kinase